MSNQSFGQNEMNDEGPPQILPSGAVASPSWFRQEWFWQVLLLLAVVVAYQPVWFAGFIWDDDRHVTRLDLRTWGGLGRIWFDLGTTPQYYPVAHSVFWLEYRLWGDEPLGYHLVNVFLLGLTALLLLKLLRQLEVPGAWLATAIFVLHPVQVESVAWVTELKNMLSGVFYFSAALAYLEFDRTRKMESYARALLFFVLGLLSKSVIATLPAALLVVFWWKRGKISWKEEVRPLVPFFAVGIFSGLFTAWVERRFVGAEGAEYHLTLVERTLIAGRAIWFYLGKLIWPADLTFIYPRWEIEATAWWQYLFPAGVVGAVAVLGWLSLRWRGPLAGFLFFCGTLFPALGYLNVYPFRYTFVEDHFQYLACLGIIVPCAAGLVRLVDFLLPGKVELRALLGAGLLLVLGTLSWQRAWVYQSGEILWTDTLAKNPTCWMARNNLGNILAQEGKMDESMALFQNALKINSDDARAHSNLGIALYQKGQVDEALIEFQKAIEIDPGLAEAHYNLGSALLNQGKVDEAIVQFQEAVRLNPHDTGSQEYLAKAQAMAKQASAQPHN
jgi:protein O-mannosyl-transferase